MYQIKVNSVLMPTIYWSLTDAIRACDKKDIAFCLKI